MKASIYILFAMLVLTACGREQSTNTNTVEPINLPDQELWKASVKMTNKGELSAVIHFGHMKRYSKKSQMIFNEGIDIDFYKEDGAVGSQLASDSGEYYLDTKNVKAMGNVSVESDSGITLYTQELFYFQNEERILSEVDVMVCTEDGDTLYGRGFESDTQMTNWVIKEPYDGVAHKGVDLSLEQFEKKERAESDNAVTDTTTAADSAAQVILQNDQTP